MKRQYMLQIVGELPIPPPGYAYVFRWRFIKPTSIARM